MGMHGQVEFGRVDGDALKGGVTDGVRGMRRQAKRQQGFIAHLVAQRDAFAKVIRGIGSVGRWELHRNDADGGAHARVNHGLCGSFRKKIHVVKAGDAAAQHFRAGEQ